MHNIGIIMRHNLREFFRNKLFIIVLILPIFIMVLLPSIFSSNQMGTIRFGILDQEQILSKERVNAQLKQFEIGTKFFEEEEILIEAIKQKSIQLGIAIEGDRWTVFKIEGDSRIDYLIEPIIGMLQNIEFLEEIEPHSEDKTYILVTFGLFVMIFLLTTVKALQPLIKEKENNVYYRIKGSGVSESSYIMGHILGGALILSIQTIGVCIGMAFVKLDLEISMLQIFMICMSLIVVGISFSLLIQSFVKTTMNYFIAASYILTPLCMVSGCTFPMAFMPKIIQNISYLSPLRWVMMAYEEMIKEARWESVMSYIGIALLMSVVIILLGLYRNTMSIEDNKMITKSS